MPETPYEREPGYARRYRDRRFHSGSGTTTDRRERRALRFLLQSAPMPDGPWLDAPCGAGRLTAELPGRAVQLDRDVEMVRESAIDGPKVCGSVHALPFRDDTFAGTLCHRLLQHIPTPAERHTILCELARVTTGPIVVSFFDACSLQHMRRSLRRLFGKTRSGRSAVARHDFLAELRAAGLRPVVTKALRRFVTEQTLVLCERATKRNGEHSN